MAQTYGLRPARVRHMMNSTYEDNYGYTMNFYQPMLDYLDAKTKGLNVPQPHLPWTSERGLKQHRPSNAVSRYNADEIVRLSRQCAARADEILVNFRATKRTPFSVKKLADASRVMKHIEPDSVIERSRERRRKRQEELEDIIRSDTIKILQRIHKLELDNDCMKMADDFKRRIRGKSANEIAQALIDEARKNLKKAHKEEEAFMAKAMIRSSRAVSVSSPERHTTAHAAHLDFVDDDLVDKLDHRVSRSLVNMKRNLSNLTHKTVAFYADSQCGIEDKCWICRKVLRTHPRLHDYSYIYYHH